LDVNRHQLPFGQHQNGQTKQRQQLASVLGEAAIASLLVFEQILHPMKRVLGSGANTRLGMPSMAAQGG